MNKEVGDILIDADELKQTRAKESAINENVKEILGSLDRDIKEINKDHGNMLRTTIPAFFDIPGLPNQISRRTIWSKVLEEIMKKNYDVGINLDIKDRCELVIRWETPEDMEEAKRQQSIIDRKRIHPQGVKG
jgi:hypothetical protein